MFETMYKAPGIGLAAPQVGVGLRVVVVDLMADDAPKPMALINPQVLKVSGRMGDSGGGLPLRAQPICRRLAAGEGDGALPGRRAARCGRSRRTVCSPRACRHELDHLDGVLFVDHLSALKRNMLLRRLAKELKQKAAG